MTRITEALKDGRILVSDGAWGTYLQKKGMKGGECPEQWCVNRPDDVRDIASSYIAAGADMLEHYGLDGEAASINEAAARISREAAGDSRWVIGSIGPTGKMLAMGDVTEEEFYDAFKEQAMALEKGGANAACIETMSDIGEACEAIRAVKENTKLEVICTFTFEKTVQGTYRTMMGVSPEDAVAAAVEAGADIVGPNCGNGMERMVDIVALMRAADRTVPILVHANAGLPVNVDGVDTFPETPEDMAKQVPFLIKAGANVIGGCCGTTPEHIVAMKKAVAEYRTGKKG